MSRTAVNLRRVDQVGRTAALLTPGAWALAPTVDVRLTEVGGSHATGSHDLKEMRTPEQATLHVGSVDVPVHVRPLGDDFARLSAGVATGIQFSPVEQAPFERALHQAAALYRDKPTWARIQANAMATDVSWNASAARYAALYRELATAQ